MLVTRHTLGQRGLNNRFSQLPKHLPYPNHPVTQISPKLIRGLTNDKKHP